MYKNVNIQSWRTAGSKEQNTKTNVYSIIARKARSREKKEHYVSCRKRHSGSFGLGHQGVKMSGAIYLENQLQDFLHGESD